MSVTKNDQNPVWISIARSSGSISLALRELHDTSGLPWRIIAELNGLKPVPNGTLCAMANGLSCPKKWRRHLMVKTDFPPRIAVHKEDMLSAARSITNNIDPYDVITLVEYLKKGGKKCR